MLQWTDCSLPHINNFQSLLAQVPPPSEIYTSTGTTVKSEDTVVQGKLPVNFYQHFFF